MKAIRTGTAIVCIGLVAALSGCSGSKQVTSNRPGWIDQGPGFFTGEKGKAFYGVGVASNINNVMLRRSTADTQARVDLARVFNTRISDLVKTYARSVSGGPEAQVSEEQLAQQTTKAFTEMDLSGTQIVDRYFDPAENAQYALAMLDLTMFKNQIQKMQELSKEVKEIIEKNAEKAFQELNEMSAKKKKDGA